MIKNGGSRRKRGRELIGNKKQRFTGKLSEITINKLKKVYAEERGKLKGLQRFYGYP